MRKDNIWYDVWGLESCSSGVIHKAYALRPKEFAYMGISLDGNNSITVVLMVKNHKPETTSGFTRRLIDMVESFIFFSSYCHL